VTCGDAPTRPEQRSTTTDAAATHYPNIYNIYANKIYRCSTGVSYATARRRYEAGALPVPTYRLGRLIMVGEPVTSAVDDAGQVVVYARVSSADQQADLDRQVARVTTWATEQHLAVSRVVTEVGSALNGHRTKFLALLRDPACRPSWSSTGTVGPLRCRVGRGRTCRAEPPAAGG
jgi:predicted site-specific integrase-resolvase